jgi:type II secretory ATPase GspE/PulE/Tfp pilus assembly ATPase PilB-like protein
MALTLYRDKSYERKTQAGDVVALVDELLTKAVGIGASDIHFEPTGSELVIKFRLDGVLNAVESLPKAVSDNVISRLKVLGGLLTYRNDVPQEGRMEINNSHENVVDRRLSVFPTIYGQRAVVRIFYQNVQLTDLGQLGFAPEIYAALKQIACANQGVLLVTGPAGSGKSATLGAVLRHIQKQFPGKSIVTLEDPVEIRLDGVTQVQITPFGPMTFPTALRSLLRQDPQVLMIGEIRDAETAKIAIEAGLTGHLLMSTMHSGSAAAAILRLLEMSIEPYQVTSSISAVLNQRLVRRLCEKCKKRTTAGNYESVGCDYCFGTGFKGRMLIAELVRLDSQLRKAILARTDTDEIEKVLTNKGHTGMVEDGGRLVAEGLTTQDELDKVCGSAGDI